VIRNPKILEQNLPIPSDVNRNTIGMLTATEATASSPKRPTQKESVS
jgi:hypothetical protein